MSETEKKEEQKTEPTPFLYDATLITPEASNLPDEQRIKFLHSIRKSAKKGDLAEGSLKESKPIPLWKECFCILLLLICPGGFIMLPLAWVLSLMVAPMTLGLLITVVFIVSWILPIPFRPEWNHSFAAQCLLEYFSFKTIIEVPLTTTVGSIFVAPPHGVFPLGNILTLNTMKRIHGIHPRGLAANALLRVPIVRQIMAGVGVVSASRSEALKQLRGGNGLGISTGGVAEIFETNADTETIMMRNRRGFVRLAMMTGAPLVPCYVFGNTGMLSVWYDSWGFLRALSRKVRFGVIPFWGRFGLPVCRRVPILMVMGTPMTVPQIDNPSHEDIAPHLAKFCEETQALFDRHKHLYGWAHKQLIIK